MKGPRKMIFCSLTIPSGDSNGTTQNGKSTYLLILNTYPSLMAFTFTYGYINSHYV